MMSMNQDIEINNKLSGDITSIINSPGYSQLSETSQRNVLDAINESHSKEGGAMGKIFGTNKDNIAIYVAFFLCIIILLVGVFCQCMGNDYWNVIFPTVTSIIGFIFGKINK